MSERNPAESTPEHASIDLRQALEQAGWRYTRQRAAVHEYLRAVHSHPTAEDVFDHVRGKIPNISLATVYKALDALVGAGLAQRHAFADGPARYDARCDAHYHLRCLRTGTIRDVPTAYDPQLIDKLDPNLRQALERQGFELLGYRLELLGHFQER
jgi:Fe2+ or Zn2+ uptake regulation protein